MKSSALAALANLKSGLHTFATRSSYWPSQGPKRGWKRYVTPAFSGRPNKGKLNHKWPPHPCLLGGPKEGRNATSAVHCQGSLTPSAGSKIRTSLQQRGTKSEVAASPLPFRGSNRGRKCHVTPALLAIPDKGEINQKWLPHPYLLEDPIEGGNAMSPLHSRGCPTKGTELRSGSLTPFFSGAQKRAEMLRHPRILGRPQQRGMKSQVVASPLPCRGPKRGRKCYVTPAFSGIPNKGDQDQMWLPHPCLLGPKRPRKCYNTPTISGIPNAKRGEQNH